MEEFFIAVEHHARTAVALGVVVGLFVLLAIVVWRKS